MLEKLAEISEHYIHKLLLIIVLDLKIMFEDMWCLRVLVWVSENLSNHLSSHIHWLGQSHWLSGPQIGVSLGLLSICEIRGLDYMIPVQLSWLWNFCDLCIKFLLALTNPFLTYRFCMNWDAENERFKLQCLFFAKELGHFLFRILHFSGYHIFSPSFRGPSSIPYAVTRLSLLKNSNFIEL